MWNSPTIDPVRHAVYFGTGDTETEPAQPLGDAVVAVDMDSGKVLWSYQAQANDAFMGGCGGQNKSKACPQTMGPDADIGNSPILSTLPDGRRVLIAGTKGGEVFALDPDNRGRAALARGCQFRRRARRHRLGRRGRPGKRLLRHGQRRHGRAQNGHRSARVVSADQCRR